jgi:predicted transcriptional regulator
MNNPPNLFTGERPVLEALKADHSGLDKLQIARQVKRNPYMVDIHLTLLIGRALVVQQGNRYYITEAGLAVLAQPMLPGMENIT